MDVTTLDKKHEEETLDVSKLIKEETISEVLPTKEITEAESSEHETPMYLYVYGVRLLIPFLCVTNGYMVSWLSYTYTYTDCRINCPSGN